MPGGPPIRGPGPARIKNGEAKVAKLGLDSIRLDAGTQTRAHIDDATVAEYAEAMLRGDRFPPVVVFQSGSDFILADLPKPGA
jgi:hypothetical protein